MNEPRDRAHGRRRRRGSTIDSVRWISPPCSTPKNSLYPKEKRPTQVGSHTLMYHFPALLSWASHQQHLFVFVDLFDAAKRGGRRHEEDGRGGGGIFPLATPYPPLTYTLTLGGLPCRQLGTLLSTHYYDATSAVASTTTFSFSIFYVFFWVVP
jgi:hypothetical protein